MPRLRDWQKRCIEKALRHYKTKNHFLCQATPAAGKTLMAAELGKRLLRRGMIDLIVCFAPTCQVVRGIQNTFESVIGRSMNGLVGSVGVVFTYPAMGHRDDSFWELFDSHRVFVVFDEIHHCAGSELDIGNAWGATIVQQIQDKSRFTLALSGTPWRSDAKPIVLARYSQPDGRVTCDFRFGLKDAVDQNVCRIPQIVLLDNESIKISERDGDIGNTRCFAGIEELLDSSGVTYGALLWHEELAIELIKLGTSKLTSLREKNENAGGLIVASNIEHANRIAGFLDALGETCCVVNNQTPDAQTRIEEFRHNDCRWIVSVGMVSEGTDIQRLQVCCYLSRIRTELHFRQVLGRILRRIDKSDDVAWFYALAEPRMKEFSSRVAEDLPEESSIVAHVSAQELISIDGDFLMDKVLWNEKTNGTGLHAKSESDLSSISVSDPSQNVRGYDVSFSQNYWQKVLSFY